ncbi:MAG TPA: hypothetical protein VJ400_01195 [Thermoplasmata archaeon]|nr:hypothetical protein [Thermoplasmata archaeon]
MKRRILQTDLSQPEYEALARVAQGRGVTLKEATREAVAQWVASEGGFEGSPLFDFRFVLKGGRATDSSDDDAVIYRRRKTRGSSSTPARS